MRVKRTWACDHVDRLVQEGDEKEEEEARWKARGRVVDYGRASFTGQALPGKL